MTVALGVCWKTAMSPEEHSRKGMSADWSAKEHSGKLTSDAIAVFDDKHRQRLAIGQHTDVT